MGWQRTVLLLVVTLLMVTSSAFALTAPRVVAAPGTTAARSVSTDELSLTSATSLATIAPTAPLLLTFTLANPHEAELAAFLSAVQDPASPQYHHFLSFPQYLERFAPPTSSLQRVEEILRSAGARDVTASPDRSFVQVVLPAGTAQQLLGVRFATYAFLGGLPLYTAVGPVELPAPLAGLVRGIGGLSDSATASFLAETAVTPSGVHSSTLSATDFAHDNSTGEDWYVGSDYTQLYGATRLFPGSGSVSNATYPTSTAIATLLVSAYNATTGNNLPPWDPAVIDAYYNGTLNPSWPQPNLTGVPVPIGGAIPPLPASYGTFNDSSSYELENSLDLEMAGSLAPGSSLYNFYFPASALNGAVSNGDVADYFAADLAAALAYPEYSPHHLVAVSCSFGIPDLNDTAWDAALAVAAATGVTVVSASGDQGNAPDSDTGRSDGQWPVWPASDANTLFGALAVGGVSVSVSGNASMYYTEGQPLNLTYDPNVGSLTSSSAWYDTSGGQGTYAGTEGGVSTVYPEPLWQFDSAAQPTIVNATLEQGASTLGRSEPDVAMPANDTLTTIAANSTGTIFFEIVGGTSVAAPVTAGLLADLVAVGNNRTESSWNGLGFIDPALYRFGSYFVNHSGASGDPFLDVTLGSNYVFSAGPGWDATTGWGELEAPTLLAAFGNSTLLAYDYTGPTPGLPPVSSSSSSGSIPWVVIFAIFGAGVVVALLLVFVATRPPRNRVSPPTVPWGAQGQAPPSSGIAGATPGATFLCPYCGAIRPSEPVRCPQCGAY